VLYCTVAVHDVIVVAYCTVVVWYGIWYGMVHGMVHGTYMVQYGIVYLAE
jgi:hypothetical protein